MTASALKCTHAVNYPQLNYLITQTKHGMWLATAYRAPHKQVTLYKTVRLTQNLGCAV